MTEKHYMKALIPGVGSASYVDVPIPTVKNNDVLLKVIRAGICKTDIWVAKGIIKSKDQCVLGHEFCGVVVDRGQSVNRFQLGQQVAVNPIIACDHCDECISDNTHLCANTTMLGIDQPGAFAEYISVPEKQCYEVEDNLSPELVAYAEPVAAALSIRDFNFNPNSSVALLGDDRISQLCRYVLATIGVEPVTPSIDNPVDVLIVTSVNEPAENSARQENLPIDLVKPGGTLILKGRSPYSLSLNLMKVVKKRLKVVALNYAPFAEALRFITEHRYYLEQLLGSCYSLREFQDAFTANSHKKVFFSPCVD